MDPVGVLDRVPPVDGRVELHPGIAALVRGLGNVVQQVLGAVALLGLLAQDGTCPPIASVAGRVHELVSDPHRVVGVLERDCRVGVPVDRRIVSVLNQHVGLLLFARLAPDEVLHVRVIDIKDHHLGGATRLAAGLDHSRERIEALHERHRARGPPATGQAGVVLADVGEVRAGARAPLEQHAFGLGQV